MAPAEVATGHAIAGVSEPSKLPVRRKYKASELPLTSAQRSSIDGLVNVIKKKGEFDSLRRKVWTQFEEGVRRHSLLLPFYKRTIDGLEGWQSQPK